MKILLDPVYTNDPQFCSMAYKMQELMKQLLAEREDVFFYFLVPSDDPQDRKWETDPSWFVQHERVKYVPLPMAPDRMRQYHDFGPQFRRLIAFHGLLWDWDVLITARIPSIADMSVVSSKHPDGHRAYRTIIAVEDMPLLPFKQCVPLFGGDVQTMQALGGYLAADRVLFFSFWEKDAMLKVARDFLAPAQLRKLASQSFDCAPATVTEDRFYTKKKSHVQAVVTGEQKFTVVYTQRMEVVHRGAQDVADLMEKHWIINEGRKNVRLLITTNTPGDGRVRLNMEAVELARPKREEFHRIMREEAMVAVVLSIDDAYPLSLLEPLILGVPVALLDRPYARATVGEDYPFFVKSDSEAFALCSAFMDDYAGLYRQFLQWRDTSLKPRLLGRNEQSFIAMVRPMLAEQERRMTEVSKTVPELVTQVAKAVGDSTFVMEDVIEKLPEARHIGQVVKNLRRRRDAIRISYSPDYHRLRLALMKHYGYRDGGVEPGTLTK